ncbi:hypothetical protein PCANC_15359 [Puccinia coronata f. sp. avenae]|uniref:Uncharacterized protein n=1 Tax=Puccinia coronata f. sp. avenae TaxID=200324 RepID=A0A2N5SS44_9BASI|nr:hypothetical protein PCANC_15359 [Puccinia coronata f. sp. avenae]
MPSHLRNGKDLLFEQQMAAKQAAERAQQLQQRAEELHGAISSPRVIGQPSSIEPISAAKLTSTAKLTSVAKLTSAAELTSAAKLTSAAQDKLQRVADPSSANRDSVFNELSDPASHRSAAGGYPPVGYSLSPAALERLRCAREQQRDTHEVQQYGPAQHGANLPARPGNSPPVVFSRATALALVSKRSTPVPHPVERLQFAVTDGRALVPSMAGPMTPTPTLLLVPMSYTRANSCATGDMVLHPTGQYSHGTASFHVPGTYASPRPSGATKARSATPVAAAATTLGQQVDGTACSPWGNNTKYWTPARYPTACHSEALPSPVVLQDGGLLQTEAAHRSATSSTPSRPSPLRSAVPTKWETVQLPLLEEDPGSQQASRQTGSDKLKEQFEGPYPVLQVFNHGQSFELGLPDGNLQHPTFHIAKVKRFVSRAGVDETGQEDLQQNINRSNTAVQAVLKQPCSTGGRTGTVRPKREPTGWTDFSNWSRLVLCDRSQELIRQACPTRQKVLWLDSACLTTSQTRLFEHRSNCCVQPVNAGSASASFSGLPWTILH